MHDLTKLKEPRNLDAYYYSFQPSGSDEIDAVLEAVAWAGHGWHNTEDWNEDYGDGDTAIQRIQRAACKSAAKVNALLAEVERLRKVEALQKQVNEHYKTWYRECIDEPFDTWLKDDATHWIGEQDAAFQAWQYLHENKIWLMKERIEEHEQERDRLKAENATLQAALIEAVRVVAKTDPEGTAAWLAALEGGGR